MTTRLARSSAILLVAIGGFAGALGRFGVDGVVGASLESTLLVNVLGSFALALIVAAWPRGGAANRERLHRLVATGFLSSFTTYSTFVVETVQTDLPLAVGYVFATYSLGFAAAVAGLAVVDTADIGTADGDRA